MKGTFHKSCNCSQCRRGRNHEKRNLNERKLRRMTKKQLRDFLKKLTEDVDVHPISSPYTD